MMANISWNMAKTSTGTLALWVHTPVSTAGLPRP